MLYGGEWLCFGGVQQTTEDVRKMPEISTSRKPVPGVFQLLGLRVIISIDAGNWHLSASCADRMPSYTELKYLRYQMLPDNIYMAEIFPPKDEFVNINPNVRHLWQVEIEKTNYPTK
jgi:hypothetical protein